MASIQSITVCGTKYRITLHDGRSFILKADDMSEFPWQEGTDADDELFMQFIRIHQYPEGLNTAVSMLSRRACSIKEITDRLKRRGICDDVSELVIYKLEKENLLNDRDFSAQWTRYRSGCHYGPARIYRELRMKGIDEETAREAISDMNDDDQMQQAVILAAKGFRKAKPDEDQRKVFQRVLRMLIQRGFDWEIAKNACDRVMSE